MRQEQDLAAVLRTKGRGRETGEEAGVSIPRRGDGDRGAAVQVGRNIRKGD